MQVKKMITVCVLVSMVLLFATGCVKKNSNITIEEESSDASDKDSDSDVDTENSEEDADIESGDTDNEANSEESKDQEESLSGEDIDENHSELIEIQEAKYIKEAKIQKKILDKLKKESVTTVYSKKYQETAMEVLTSYISKSEYSIDAPLMIENPYGTLDQSMYLYYKAQQPCKLQYTISVDNDAIPDYQAEIRMKESEIQDPDTEEVEAEIETEDTDKESVEEKIKTEDKSIDIEAQDQNDKKEKEIEEVAQPDTIFEGMLVGMIPGEKNYITLTEIDDSGKTISEKVFCLNLEQEITENQMIYQSEEAVDREKAQGQSQNGFYVLMGKKNAMGTMTFLDANGIRRSEINTETKITMDAVVTSDSIVFPKNNGLIVQMDRFGHVIGFYAIDGYHYENSLVYDEETNSIYLIASKKKRDTKGDILLNLNLSTGDVKEVVDCSEMFSDIFQNNESGSKDLLGLDSIDMIDSNQLLINSNRFSSIFCVDDIKEKAKLSHIVADKKIWSNTSYSGLVYEPIGSFVPFAGQSNIDVFTNDKRLIEGQYYIIMYNHNYGEANKYPVYDWSNTTDVVTADTEDTDQYTSSYYKVFVDENTKTFTLAERVQLPYEKDGGSIHLVNDSFIYFQENLNGFSEYSSDGKVFGRFVIENAGKIDQVRYFDLTGFW